MGTITPPGPTTGRAAGAGAWCGPVLSHRSRKLRSPSSSSSPRASPAHDDEVDEGSETQAEASDPGAGGGWCELWGLT